MYDDDVSPTLFFLVISITLPFQIKTNSNSKNFAQVGFCGLKVSTDILQLVLTLTPNRF